MNWNLLVTNPAKKDLKRFPNPDQIRIERALYAIEADPFSGDIKRLQPSGGRRRIGNCRMFYDLDIHERRVVVTAIQRRASTTY